MWKWWTQIDQYSLHDAKKLYGGGREEEQSERKYMFHC